MVIDVDTALAEKSWVGKRPPQKAHNRLRGQIVLQPKGKSMPAYPLRLVLAALLLTPLSFGMCLAREQQRKEPVISVTGQGEAALAPDLAIVTLSVAETARTAREALDANNK